MLNGVKNIKELYTEKFDYCEYQAFVKKAFQKSDAIIIFLNKAVKNISELSVGRNSFIGKNLINVENCDDDRMSPFIPYAMVEVQKNFDVFEALKRIEKWSDFYGEDEECNYYMLALTFLKDGTEIGHITSHYVDYYSEFGWNK